MLFVSVAVFFRSKAAVRTYYGFNTDGIEPKVSLVFLWETAVPGFTLETEAYIKPVFSSLSIQSGIRFGGKILVEETTVRFSDGLQGI